MKIVVDTNIVFSAILNTQGKIGQILISGSKHFEFCSVGLLKDELKNHQEKILKISGYSFNQYEEILQTIISKISFIDDIFISDHSIKTAWKLTKDIDENDTLFIALAHELNSHVWTGDKKLISGLSAKGYQKLLSTEKLYKIFLEQEYKKRK
ncbi:MAG: PIN domain-containing protein [Bacteroidia bacterium]|nr:PIN domain-containing protein [Bacteroidia bacterium]